jgi:hypothetical protein
MPTLWVSRNPTTGKTLLRCVAPRGGGGYALWSVIVASGVHERAQRHEDGGWVLPSDDAEYVIGQAEHWAGMEIRQRKERRMSTDPYHRCRICDASDAACENTRLFAGRACCEGCDHDDDEPDGAA